jgi:hypothetical protein
MRHEARQVPSWLIFDVGQKIMIRGLKVFSPRKAATGMDGGHAYVCGTTEWNGSETPVFVFLKDHVEEGKLEDAMLAGPMTFDAARHDFVLGHGLSLFDAEIK